MKISGFGHWVWSVAIFGMQVASWAAETPSVSPPLPSPVSPTPKPPTAVRPLARPGSIATVRTGGKDGATDTLQTVNATANRLPAAPAATTPVTLDPEALQWDSKQKEVSVKPGETEARFMFSFTNVSKNEISLQRIQTSCGCTAARLPQEPWLIPAGGRGDISVVMDVRGKMAGKATKTATVYSSVGQIPLLVTSVIPPNNNEARPMGDRSRNLQIAAADRQAPLRGECATCHVTPAIGKSGKVLFDTACGICHTAEHRASFVPDLAKLTKPTDITYWTSWITFGREGSMMPAFHKTKGGFLSDEDIHSLATYMETEYKIEAALNAVPQKTVPPLFPGPLAPPAQPK